MTIKPSACWYLRAACAAGADVAAAAPRLHAPSFGPAPRGAPV